MKMSFSLTRVPTVFLRHALRNYNLACNHFLSRDVSRYLARMDFFFDQYRKSVGGSVFFKTNYQLFQDAGYEVHLQDVALIKSNGLYSAAMGLCQLLDPWVIAYKESTHPDQRRKTLRTCFRLLHRVQELMDQANKIGVPYDQPFLTFDELIQRGASIDGDILNIFRASVEAKKQQSAWAMASRQAPPLLRM